MIQYRTTNNYTERISIAIHTREETCNQPFWKYNNHITIQEDGTYTTYTKIYNLCFGETFNTLQEAIAYFTK